MQSEGFSVHSYLDGLGRAVFCHAVPGADEPIVTRITPDADVAELIGDVEAGLVVCGHTHVQFDRRVDGVRIVNAGSIGMPYEDEPGAYWALVGPDVELRRTEYEPADIEAAGWPEEWPYATPDEATEFFERVSRERA